MTYQIASGHKGHWLLGNLPEFRADSLGHMTSLSRMGDLTRTTFGPTPVYTIHHPDLVHQVLVEDTSKYYKARQTKRVLKKSVGNGLLISEGDFWRRQRKLVQPAFHMKRIEAYAGIMVEHTQRMLANWRDGREHDIAHEMVHVTLGIVSKTLFDADVSDEAFKLGEAITVGVETAMRQFNRLFPIPWWIPTKDNRAGLAALKVIDDSLLRIISERRASGEDKGDLLSMLLIAQDEDDGGQMTDKQVRDEAFLLFVAGHETTATALTWTWYLLAQHPEVEAKLHEEVDRVLGGRAPLMSDLPNLPYTEMVVKEAMRLYPPAWILSREPIENVTIGGIPVKRNSVVIVCPYSLQRDPRWFDEPERFLPERFSKENEKNIHKYAYIPFGGGPRVCIGNSFAMMEARLIVATIAQQFRLALQPGQTVTPEPLVTLRPKGGLPMRVTERVQAVDQQVVMVKVN